MSEGIPRDLLGGDPEEVERGLDEWVAGFERNAARYQELQHRVEEVRLSATSPSGVVTVTIDANGVLTDVRFSDRLIQTTPEELRRQLLDAVEAAKAGIVGRVREVAADTVGEEGAERIVGYYGQRFSGIGEPDPGPPQSEHRDDDDFGGDSIFRR